MTKLRPNQMRPPPMCKLGAVLAGGGEVRRRVVVAVVVVVWLVLALCGWAGLG